LVEAFEQEMRRLRYVEGENILIEKRVLRPNSSDLAAQAAELAHMNLDLIVAGALVHALEVRKTIRPCRWSLPPARAWSATASPRVQRPGGIYTGIDELPPG